MSWRVERACLRFEERWGFAPSVVVISTKTDGGTPEISSARVIESDGLPMNHYLVGPLRGRNNLREENYDRS